MKALWTLMFPGTIEDNYEFKWRGRHTLLVLFIVSYPGIWLLYQMPPDSWYAVPTLLWIIGGFLGGIARFCYDCIEGQF